MCGGERASVEVNGASADSGGGRWGQNLRGRRRSLGAAEERDAWCAAGQARCRGGCKQRAFISPECSPSSDKTTYVMAACAVTPSKLVAIAQEHKEERTCEQD